MAFYLMDIGIAYLLDLILGDPLWLPHPIRLIGWWIKRVEGFLRAGLSHIGTEEQKAGRERRAGTLLTIIVVGCTFFAVFGIQRLAGWIHPVLSHLVNIYFIYTALATKCLGDEAHKVFRTLRAEDLVSARIQLGMLVGRQTEGLSENEIIRGVVETTAENTTDGIVAPLCYAFAGALAGISAPLVYAFKAISTLDSMVGYMNEKYLHMGRTSAKVDDAANYFPARLTGLLIPLSAFLCRKDARRSFRIMRRDRRNHKSPNCAYAEAAVAGALGIRIGGTNVYFGQMVEKPTIGDADKELEPKDISDTITLMYVSSFLTLVLGFLLLLGLMGGLGWM